MKNGYKYSYASRPAIEDDLEEGISAQHIVSQKMSSINTAEISYADFLTRVIRHGSSLKMIKRRFQGFGDRVSSVNTRFLRMAVFLINIDHISTDPNAPSDLPVNRSHIGACCGKLQTLGHKFNGSLKFLVIIVSRETCHLCDESLILR